ncbi:ATP-binding protein [Leucobacter sp. VD1]|uniref:ATP-binding protein n=1 Tax=Leucobacter sp. VD1 TaxID=3080381 RepID=UPI003016396E
MQRGTASHRDELPQALANHLSDTDEPVLLTGPHGSGKTHTLRALSALLTSTGTPHLVARGASNDSAPRLAQLPAGTLVLFDDYELASYETLQAIARHITDGGKVVATVTEAHVDTGYGERMRRLYELFPEAQQTLERTRSIRLAPFTDSEIANIVHRANPEPLTSVTVAAIQQLSWGLPGAALTLLQLHRSGSLSSTPRPRITRTHTVDMHLAALHQPVRVAEAQLSSEQVAAAVVLSEIGPRSRSGIADVFGATTQANLFDSGFLLPHPGSVEVFGVPELYAAAVRNLTSAEVLKGIRQSTAMHLLSQETLGIPMPDREAIFCARVLSRHDSSLTADPLLDEHHARFLQRIIDDLLCFGEANGRATCCCGSATAGRHSAPSDEPALPRCCETPIPACKRCSSPEPRKATASSHPSTQKSASPSSHYAPDFRRRRGCPSKPTPTSMRDGTTHCW